MKKLGLMSVVLVISFLLVEVIRKKLRTKTEIKLDAWGSIRIWSVRRASPVEIDFQKGSIAFKFIP